MGKHLVDKDIVMEEGDGLGEDGIVMVQGQCEDSLIEDGVSQDIDQEDVTCSVAKAFLGSAKTRRVILMKRPTSFWA